MGVAEASELTEIRAGRQRATADSLRELWQFREVLWAFAVKRAKVKYKQAAVGVGWAILQPLVLALLFALVLGRFSKVPSEGVPYLVFVLPGLVAWTFFSESAADATESLVDDQALLRKIYFPRAAAPLGSIAAGLLDLCPALLVLAGVLALYGYMPGIEWLALPLIVIVLVLTATGLGLALSAVNVYYRDARYALPLIFRLGLFATPIVYPLSLIPSPWDRVWEIANPVAAAVEGIRAIAIRQHWPDPGVTLAALAWALILLIAGFALFKRMESGFADRV